ncbi:unnamed protein product [Coffea canephora]|uniref:RING-type domain-containing protein n=1 Tax=Coffea canephora TaxID=49390 RepID=A0A068U5W1_COFCA|nr:unnamed protein product [Coffea canephora]
MSNLTLSAVLKTEDRSGGPMRTPSNRTLMDIIREDPNGGGYSKDTRKSWRHFREKLRLRRQGSGSSWTSSVPVPASDVPIQHPMGGSSSSRRMMMSRRDSTRLNTPTPDQTSQPDADLSSGVPRSRSSMLQRNESRAIRGRYDNARGIDDEMGAEEGEETEGETTEEEEGGGGGTGGGEEQPVRMSLMALLAETDRQMGLDGSGFTMDDDEDADEEEEEEEEGGAGGGGYNNCCVCMVRHKGAAFIPCGHTFCRLCSRELWVQRGNCPLCNNFILEILDIF